MEVSAQCIDCMQVEQIVTIKSLVHRLKSDPTFKRSLGFDYLDRTPSEATLNRFVNTLAGTDIMEKTYRKMILQARKLGIIDGTNVAIDASKLTAYEHSVPKSKILENNPEFPPTFPEHVTMHSNLLRNLRCCQ